MASAAILRLPSRNRSVKLDDGPGTVRLVQSEILRSGYSYTALALKADCSVSTVANIAIGHTKRPALSTVARIMMALGWSIYAHQE